MALASPYTAIAEFRRLARWLRGWSAGSFESLGDSIWRVAEDGQRSVASTPLMCSSAPCGFPSPADDYLDRPLDFNELLIENPAATFAVRVDGDSMIGAGIFPGDIAVVNRARTAVDGSVVLALVDGEFTIKRYRRRGVRCWLQPENSAFEDLEIADGMTFEVWGVISRCIRFL
jgi:DNA polymerase V